LANFEEMAANIGLTPEAVAAIRAQPTKATCVDTTPSFAIDHDDLLAELVAGTSCATAQEALALICEKAVGWASPWARLPCRQPRPTSGSVAACAPQRFYERFRSHDWRAS
jgi:hypothetical protein